MVHKKAVKRTTTALQERVKELTCLLRMADIAGKPGISMEAILQQTTGLLVSAWQYPEVASARVVLDGQTYAAAGFRESPDGQRSDVLVRGVKRGFVEVIYVEPRPERD